MLKVRLVVCLAATLVGALVSMSSASATVRFPKHCGSFIVEGEEVDDRITVFNSDGLSCRLATEVIEAFWAPGEAHHHHGGRSEVESWWTTDQFPLWRCFSGAGGGGCLHKHKLAGYEAKTA